MPIAATAIKAKIVLRNIVLSSLFPCTPHNLSAGKTLPIRQKKPAGASTGGLSHFRSSSQLRVDDGQASRRAALCLEAGNLSNVD
jgi:hypothetical protein